VKISRPFPHSKLLLACIATATLLSCKAGYTPSTGEGSEPDEGDLVFHGPGSSWLLAMDPVDETFELTRAATPGGGNNLEISGEYSELSNGFLKLSISDATSGSNVVAGTSYYGIEIGTELKFLQPIGSSQPQIIALVESNGCPTSFTGNWLQYKWENTSNSESHTENQFGVFAYSSVEGDNIRLDSQYNLDDPTDERGDLVLSSGLCEDDINTSDNRQYHFSPGTSTLIELASSNADISNGISNNTQFLINLEQRNLSATTDFNSTLIGFYYNQQNGSVEPVLAECTSGVCSINIIDDVESGQLRAGDFALTFEETDINTPSRGFVTGELTNPNNQVGATVCSINRDYDGSGDLLIACVGIAPESIITPNYTNLFLVSQ